MYQIAQIDPARISDIEIPNQDRMQQYNVSVLKTAGDAYRELKELSSGFEAADEDLKKADKLFVQVLRKTGFEVPDTKTGKEPIDEEAEKERIRISARAREREAEALEIELMLNIENEEEE